MLNTMTVFPQAFHGMAIQAIAQLVFASIAVAQNFGGLIKNGSYIVGGVIMGDNATADATLKQNCVADNDYDWSYHGTENGVSHWSQLFPDCGLDNQSPIDIENEEFQAGYPPIVVNNFEAPITSAQVLNQGYTVTIIPTDGVSRTVSFGAQDYAVKNISFHFGTKNDPGADHTINGVKYTMEMEIFMVSTDNLVNSLFSVLMNVVGTDNPALAPIVDVLPDVQYKDQVTNLETDLVLADILPKKTGQYYDFYGYIARRNVPPCPGGYIYFILQDSVTVGTKQLAAFNKLYSVGKADASANCKMGPNHRPVQPFGFRLSFYGPWFLSPN